MTSTSSRQASTIQPGDFVSYMNPHGTVYWGTARSTVLNDGPWPAIRVDFHHEDHRPRLVPARDVTLARPVGDPRRCVACGQKRGSA
jgi:hypothetical protein